MVQASRSDGSGGCDKPPFVCDGFWRADDDEGVGRKVVEPHEFEISVKGVARGNLSVEEFQGRVRADENSVVNNMGRVHDMEGLRIVDASIMPEIVTGNLNAPVIMMAERIVDDIRGRTPLEPEKAPYYTA